MAKREKVFSVAEWAPLHEAFARAEAALGSHPHAWLDVRAHLLSGRLRSAVRRKVAHELLFEQLEPVFWETYLWTHPDSEPDDEEGYSEWFLVSRRDLDRLYATEAQTAPSPKPAGRPGRDPDLSGEQKRRGMKRVLAALKKQQLINKDAVVLLRERMPDIVASDRRLVEDIIRPARRLHRQQKSTEIQK